METPGLEGEGGRFAGISAASLLQNNTRMVRALGLN